MGLTLIGNVQIAREEAKKAEFNKEVAKIEEASAGLVNDLASHIRSAWESAKWEKQKFHDQMIANLLQKRGEYTPQKLAEVRELGSEIYMKITDVKCRTAVYLLRKIFSQPGEKCWAIEPTHIPKLTPEMEKLAEVTFTVEVENFMSQMDQAGQTGIDPMTLRRTMLKAMPKFKEEFKEIVRDLAEEKAKAMEEKMDDQLEEGGYYKSLMECFCDIVDLKAGILTGPIYRQKMVRDVVEGKNGRGKAVWKKKIVKEWDAPSPFDIFPAPGSTGPDDGFLIEHLYYSRRDLQSMIDLPGFDEEAIRKVLDQFQTKGLHEWTWDEQERIEAEGRESAQYYTWDKIDCLKYNGDVPGRLLILWAGAEVNEETGKAAVLDHEIDPDFDYAIVAYLIDRWILKVSINENPNGEKPYYVASYVDQKGSFWGRGLPETIDDGQALANQSGRAMQNNIGVSSGFQAAIDTESLAPGQTLKIIPNKIWRFIRNVFSSSKEPFMQFFQPQMHAGELRDVYSLGRKICDEGSGIMGTTHGDPNVGGAGNTLGGFSLLLGQQNIGIEGVTSTIDRNIVIPSITDLYFENFELDDALDYIGDVNIIARGTSNLILKQQQALRRNDWLRLTANPVDSQIMGIEGRTYVLKQSAKELFEDPDRVVPERVKPIPIPQKGMVPIESGPNLDQAGNPRQGTENKLPVGQGG